MRFWYLCLLIAIVGESHAEVRVESLLRRMDQELRETIQDGGISRTELSPLIIASFKIDIPEVQRDAHLNSLIKNLKATLSSEVIYCAPCEQTEVKQNKDELTYMIAAPTAAEIRDFDARRRVNGAGPARAVLFVSLSELGITYRFVDPGSSRVLIASTLSPDDDYNQRSLKSFTLREEWNRTARGEVLAHTFYDLGAYPSPHIGVSWLEQWGQDNSYLTGFSMSLVNPLLGLGVAGFKAMPNMNNTLVGGKVLFGLPRLLQDSASKGENNASDITGNPIELVGMIRYPIGRTSMGVIGYISTSGIGVGFSF